MRKSILFAALILTATFTPPLLVNAGNWTVGLTPVGVQNLKLNFKETGDKFTYNYRTVIGFSVAVESIFQDGIVELSHYRGALTGKEHEGDKLYMKDDDGEIRVTSFMKYYGKVLNDGNRLQFPLYAGAGVGKIKEGVVNTLTLELGAKAGAKFYLTNTMGLFANAGFHLGLGREKLTSETYGDLRPSVRRADMYVELGVVVDINLF